MGCNGWTRRAGGERAHAVCNHRAGGSGPLGRGRCQSPALKSKSHTSLNGLYPYEIPPNTVPSSIIVWPSRGSGGGMSSAGGICDHVLIFMSYIHTSLSSIMLVVHPPKIHILSWNATDVCIHRATGCTTPGVGCRHSRLAIL